MLNEMDGESPFSSVDSVKGSIATDPQLEQTLPLASQRLRRYCIEMLGQPTELVKNPLGYGFIQTDQVISGLRHPFQTVHVTTPGQVEQQPPGQGCLWLRGAPLLRSAEVWP
jgi:hypothetical protein